MTARVRHFIELWLCLEPVEQEAIYELLVHRVRCVGEGLSDS